MVATIEIPDEIMKRLQALARPFVDTTPLAVMLRGVECLEKRRGDEAATAGDQTYVLPNRPNVRFTRILTAELDGDAIVHTNWNDLYRRVHEVAFKQLGGLAALSEISRAGLSPGHRTDAGYVYVASGDFSLQATDANTALLIIYQIVARLGVSLRLEVEWRDKPEAERPGQRTVILWSPE